MGVSRLTLDTVQTVSDDFFPQEQDSFTLPHVLNSSTECSDGILPSTVRVLYALHNWWRYRCSVCSKQLRDGLRWSWNDSRSAAERERVALITSCMYGERAGSLPPKEQWGVSVDEDSQASGALEVNRFTEKQGSPVGSAEGQQSRSDASSAEGSTENASPSSRDEATNTFGAVLRDLDVMPLVPPTPRTVGGVAPSVFEVFNQTMDATCWRALHGVTFERDGGLDARTILAGAGHLLVTLLTPCVVLVEPCLRRAHMFSFGLQSEGALGIGADSDMIEHAQKDTVLWQTAQALMWATVHCVRSGLGMMWMELANVLRYGFASTFNPTQDSVVGLLVTNDDWRLYAELALVAVCLFFFGTWMMIHFRYRKYQRLINALEGTVSRAFETSPLRDGGRGH